MAHCQIALCDPVPVLPVGEAPIVLRFISLIIIVCELSYYVHLLN